MIDKLAILTQFTKKGFHSLTQKNKKINNDESIPF